MPGDVWSYNPLYEILVDDPENTQEALQGVIAYGLYKHAKREWVSSFYERHSRGPEDEELATYVRTWTPSRIEGLRSEARNILAEYAGEVLREAEPAIIRNALRGQFWRGVWPSMVATLLYSVTLVVLYIVLSNLGVDVLTVFGERATP